MPTVTASMFFASLSNITRKSLYFATCGNLVLKMPPLAGRPIAQRDDIRPVLGVCRIAAPMPPQPTPAG
ncbi:MAG: hypothetical protein U0872_01925 [Planctomycetaceae bacterium]